MNRRTFLSLSLYLPLAALASQGNKVSDLDAALRWLDAMPPPPRSIGAWPLVSVLDHLAQSIEMSMDGFPEMKSAVFQRTAGAAAFAYFKYRGAMSHDLAAPIPGAPALSTGEWQAAAQRLRRAIVRFQAHNGALKPHFAYGDLSKADYAIAHTLHIANHQDALTTM
jgi:hypothetical protein